MKAPSEYFNEAYLKEYFNKNIRKKKGGGRDNLTPEKYFEKYGDEFGKICQKCLDGSYRFSYYNEKLVVKSSKKLPRVLSIPTVRDRLVLGVLNDYLSDTFPECVNHLVPNSLIYRISKYIENHSQEEISFLRTDFHNFYGTLYIKLLMNMIADRVTDGAICDLIYKAITTRTISGSAPKRNKRPRWQGIPQGLAISNILAAIYMQAFDMEFGGANAGLYIRYVDDILFLDIKKQNLLDEMISEIKRRNLKLTLSVDKCKSGIVGKDSLDFIGYTINNKIFIRKKNVTNFLNRIAALSSKCKSGLANPYQRPLFIKDEDRYNGYYVEEFNLLLSGFKYGNRLYGWLPYFQAITDVSSLYGMDHVIKNTLLKGLPKEITLHTNSLVDTYYDIHRNGGNNMVANFDKLETIDEKLNFLCRRGRIDRSKPYTDEQILNHFDSYMDLIKRVSEHNIGQIS